MRSNSNIIDYICKKRKKTNTITPQLIRTLKQPQIRLVQFQRV
jgi:hypothetical protein